MAELSRLDQPNASIGDRLGPRVIVRVYDPAAGRYAFAPALTSDSWIDTTDGMQLETGKKYIVHPGHVLQFPDITGLNNQSIRLAPSQGSWTSLGAAFLGHGVQTVHFGSLSLKGSDTIEFIARQVDATWLATGEGVLPSVATPLFTAVSSVLELPDPTTIPVGEVFHVTNDPLPSHNSRYVSAGNGAMAEAIIGA